jgi:tryptophanase
LYDKIISRRVIMVKQVYEMTVEEREQYIKKKGLNKAQTKYKNMFRLIENLRSVK